MSARSRRVLDKWLDFVERYGERKRERDHFFVGNYFFESIYSIFVCVYIFIYLIYVDTWMSITALPSICFMKQCFLFIFLRQSKAKACYCYSHRHLFDPLRWDIIPVTSLRWPRSVRVSQPPLYLSTIKQKSGRTCHACLSILLGSPNVALILR